MEQPTFCEAIKVWWRIGILSFGGPAAQIALMHREIVEENKWLSEQDFLRALSFCMLLPGPEAMQLATYAGWRLHGTLGGLAAGLLFVLPGAFVVLALSALYLLYGSTSLLAILFLGIKAAVLVIVFEALLKVAHKSLHKQLHWIIAGFSFVALFFLGLPFPLIILTAAIFGYFGQQDNHGHLDHRLDISWQKTARTIIMWLAIWAIPILLITPLTGQPILQDLGIFFSKLATVTFGGAYAVLAYMAQDAVQNHAWLTAAEMVDGLGLAETTPGPLILVTEFVGFLAGARADGSINWTGGILAACITLWATFAPCFLWVFAGAPYIEWLTSKPKLRATLSAISAAVVGVILNLSLWFALHVLFDSVNKVQIGPIKLSVPELASTNLPALGLLLVAIVLLHFLKKGIFLTLSACGGLSWLLYLATPGLF